MPTSIALLGFGGLLPPMALILLGLTRNPATHDISFWGVVYGALILTFLGGCWWAFAARMQQAPLGILVLAVLPSLCTFVALVMLFSFAAWSPFEAGLWFGGAILLSPLVDGWLAKRRLTPRWWMRLRWPLSIGLGLLVIASGWLAA